MTLRDWNHRSSMSQIHFGSQLIPRGWNTFSSVDTTRERSSGQRLTEKQTKDCSVLAMWRTRLRKRSGWPWRAVLCLPIRNQQEKVRPPGGGNDLASPEDTGEIGSDLTRHWSVQRCPATTLPCLAQLHIIYTLHNRGFSLSTSYLQK